MKNYILFTFAILLSCNSMTKKSVKVFIPEGKPINQIRFSNDILYLDIITSKQDTLTFLTDTGGGKLVYPEVAEKLGVKIDSITENDQLLESIELSETFSNLNIPSPVGTQFIYRGRKRTDFFNAGILGGNWFARKIWKFEYDDKKLSEIDSLNWNVLDKENTVTLGFLKDNQANQVTYFPRVPIIVEGDTIQTLFDTGASTILNKKAQSHFNGEKNVAASFIIESIFNKWKKEHPDWLIIKKGDKIMNEDLIRVPKVDLGGYTVGPVWFTKRKDANFSKFMSQFMDQTIEGAIGGSCFKYFNCILLDCKEEKAFFWKEENH